MKTSGVINRSHPARLVGALTPASQFWQPASRSTVTSLLSNKRIQRNISSITAQSTQTSDASSTAATSSSSTWSSFAEVASGEWDGATATFDYDGEAQQLPEYYVPQAFRDWGVQIYDWQCQCSMIANDQGLKYSFRRMMPTVGCEADAIAFTQESTDNSTEFVPPTSPNFSYNTEGGYSLLHGDFNDANCFKAAVEHCLPLETPKLRVRVVHRFQRVRAGEPWKLFFIEVVNERYDRPQDGREELQGCAGGMSTFAKDAPLDTATTLNQTKWVVTSNSNDATTSREWSVPEGASLVALPSRTWSAVQVGSDGTKIVSVGGTVLESGDVMKVSMREVVGGASGGGLAELLTLNKQ